MDEVRTEKQALRARMHDVAASLRSDDAARWSEALCNHLDATPALQRARTILLTLPLPGEADLRRLADRLLERGVSVCLPRVDWENRSMTAIRVRSLTEGVVEGRHGVREPGAGPRVEARALDAILVPGLAFDRLGGRLGRGAGFFDRLLDDTRARGRAWICGVCLDLQLVERVPMESHDVVMDAVATESGVSPVVRSAER